MKKINSILFLIITVFLVSCNNTQTTEFIDPVEGNYIETRERYDNKFDETKIPNQWEGDGIGDPYILRYNGEYYLYCTTGGNQIGVRAWKSSDLINWTVVNNGINAEGYVSEDPITNIAFAPEVIYWDGMFYMYTSPGGAGHYILESESPVGPFTVVSPNLGQSIDGSVFIDDDDESMYFLRASNRGIRMITMANPTTLETGTTLDNTLMGNWNEAATLIKRFGIYYLTYTGTHFLSPGYRVNYSTATVLDGRDSFSYGDNNSLLISTIEEFQGLGHSTTVLGPNLDSYYLGYHNLNINGGPSRSFNINRLLFNGTMMNVNGASLTGNIVPQLPDFESVDGNENYTETNGVYVSNTSTKQEFTAEFNFTGIDTKLYFGYIDEDNYAKVSFEANRIILAYGTDGTEEEIASGTLINTFDFTKLHTVRVISDGTKVSVLFDNLTKIEEVELELSAGKIAYDSEDMMYSSFSNFAFGSSDAYEPKKDMVGANQYVPESSSDVSLQVIGALENYSTNNPTGSYEVTIAKKNGFASYYVDIENTGLYALFMNLNSNQSKKQLAIQIDDAEPIVVTLPTLDSSYDYINTKIAEIEIPKGVHQIKFIALDDDITFNYFNLEFSFYSMQSFNYSLTEPVLNGDYYQTVWTVDEGHHAMSENRQLVYFGDEIVRNCTIEVDMKFVGETGAATAGIILRGSNFSDNSHENNDSVTGYYIGFSNYRAFIDKYNYSFSDYGLDVDTNNRFESGVTYTVKVIIEGNIITVFVDDVKSMEYYDADVFMTGRFGLLTQGAEVIYTNLKITVNE